MMMVMVEMMMMMVVVIVSAVVVRGVVIIPCTCTTTIPSSPMEAAVDRALFIVAVSSDRYGYRWREEEKRRVGGERDG